MWVSHSFPAISATFDDPKFGVVNMHAAPGPLSDPATTGLNHLRRRAKQLPRDPRQ